MKNKNGNVKRRIICFIIIFVKDLSAVSDPNRKFLIFIIFNLSYDISEALFIGNSLIKSLSKI
jgi:hypothetical protein